MNLLDAAVPFHRGLAVSAMPDTATRVRPTLVPDGQGGETAGPPDLSLSFPCRLWTSKVTPLEQAQAGRVVAVMQYTMECPHGTDVKPTDQVQVGPGLFEVYDDADKRTSAIVMTVNLREVR